MNRFQAITDVRQRALDDHAHRVIDERLFHLVLYQALFDSVVFFDGFHILRQSDLDTDPGLVGRPDAAPTPWAPGWMREERLDGSQPRNNRENIRLFSLARDRSKHW